MKKLILILLCLAIALSCFAETSEKLIVTADLLNGRARPSTRSTVEARFYQGDDVVPTGKWSKDYNWVEVYGGETGTVWLNIKFVSEITYERKYTNNGDTKVKIRKKPVGGGVVAYLKSGKSITVSKIVNGWGKCKKGWIDLSYLTEE